MSPAPSVTATTVVAADPATAFEVFTSEVDAWWKRGPQFRPSVRGPGVLQFEPRVGGRFLEVYKDGSSCEFGRITVWEPGERLAFQCRARDFGPDEFTEVDVRFETEAGGTRVTLENRGWDRFPNAHPVRHGMGEPAFSDVMGVWWADVLVGLQSRIAGAAA